MFTRKDQTPSPPLTAPVGLDMGAMLTQALRPTLTDLLGKLGKLALVVGVAAGVAGGLVVWLLSLAVG